MTELRQQELTVNPRGKGGSFSVLPKVVVMKLSRHSAQKSSLYYQLTCRRLLAGGELNNDIQFLPIFLFLLFCQSVFGLGDLKLAMTLKIYETDSEIGSSQV